MKKIFSFILILAYNLITSQNVKIIYSNKEYPYEAKEAKPSFNYKLKVFENGNTLSVLSYDNKILKYKFFDNTGKELYNGEVQSLYFPLATTKINYFLVNKNILKCYSSLFNKETKKNSIYCFTIDMDKNILLSEINIMPESEQRNLTLFCNNEESHVGIIEQNEVENTLIYKFYLIDTEGKINATYTTKFDIDYKEVGYSSFIKFDYIANNSILCHNIIQSKDAKAHNGTKLILRKINLLTSETINHEITFNFTVVNFDRQKIYNPYNNQIFYNFDIVSKENQIIDLKIEHHLRGLLLINIDDIQKSKINYINSDDIKKIVTSSEEGKKAVDYAYHEKYIILPNQKMALLTNTYLSGISKIYATILLNLNGEIQNFGNFIYPSKKFKEQIDIASSVNGYYLIDVRKLNKNEITNEAQKNHSYFIITHINSDKITTKIIAEDYENNIENNYYKSTMSSYDQSHRKYDLKYDSNLSNTVFCYMIKNDKTLTYKFVWIYFG